MTMQPQMTQMRRCRVSARCLAAKPPDEGARSVAMNPQTIATVHGNAPRPSSAPAAAQPVTWRGTGKSITASRGPRTLSVPSVPSAVHLFAVCVALVIAIATLSAQQPSRSQQHGRLFPPLDLGLLEAPDRVEWQRPDQIMDALGIADGSTVADVGAGSGWFTIQLARRVGPNGLVFAQDVQSLMLAALSRRVQREGLRNVRPVLGRENDPALPHGSSDAVLIVGVYHEIEDRVTFLANAATALKPQGRLGVIDFRLEGGGPGPAHDERVSPDVVKRDAAAAGLPLLREESFLAYQYFLIFGRPEPTSPHKAGSTIAAKRTLPISGRTKG